LSALPDAPQLLKLADRWTFLLIGVALVVVAVLVNRYSPQSRKHLRRTVVLFGFYVLMEGVSLLLVQAGAKVWGPRLHTGSNFLEAFTLVALAGFVIFDLVLPKLKIEVVSITSDLLIGVAYVVTAIGVAHGAGLDPTSVVATSAIVSAVLALSLQATLGNILGGVALQLDGSIHVNDWVQLENGRQGKVKEIRWRHTVLETRDWDTIIVPNALLLANNITILGKREGEPLQQRRTIMFAVDFRWSGETVIGAVTEALVADRIRNVAATPKPYVVCFDLARDNQQSYALYGARYWLTDLSADNSTDSVIRGRIHAALRRAGIPLARQAQTLFMTMDDATDDKKRRFQQRRIEAVNGIGLFKGLTDSERESIAERLRFAPFSAGETMTRQGATAHWLYLLTRGKAEIRAHTDSVSQKVATLDAPDYFGEMGLMTGEARTADVVALCDVECYRLDREGFEKVLRDRPEIAQGISEVMAKRRVALQAAREGLDAATKRAREATEQERILEKIRDFFGLAE